MDWKIYQLLCNLSWVIKRLCWKMRDFCCGHNSSSDLRLLQSSFQSVPSFLSYCLLLNFVFSECLELSIFRTLKILVGGFSICTILRCCIAIHFLELSLDSSLTFSREGASIVVHNVLALYSWAASANLDNNVFCKLCSVLP